MDDFARDARSNPCMYLGAPINMAPKCQSVFIVLVRLSPFL